MSLVLGFLRSISGGDGERLGLGEGPRLSRKHCPLNTIDSKCEKPRYGLRFGSEENVSIPIGMSDRW
jgi:hypothetical protein